MKKIIVAGCGHGGLTAAAALSKNGYDVTVIEKSKKDELGYDWHDSVLTNLFVNAGMPVPEDAYYLPADRMCYYNPKKTVKVTPEIGEITGYGYIDRKLLIKSFIDYAAECGVKFMFDTEIVSALSSAQRVEGVKYIENRKEKNFFADLVIDSCGMFSPVRLSLPDRFCIRNTVKKDEVFIGWRGYFEKTENIITDPESNTYFFHCGRCGMDWAITKDGYMDILVGGFSSLTEADVEEALEDFRKEYPYMSEKLLCGGYSDRIPVGKNLPVFVYNGYAAVGNSAYMTEPLSGSGIDLSIYAGRVLSDVIIESGGDFSAKALWKYNYRYIKEQGERRYISAIIKEIMSSLSGQDIDFLMEKNIMTQKEIAGTGGNYTVKDYLYKLNVLRKPKLCVPLLHMLDKIVISSKLTKNVPEKYSKKEIRKWSALYAKL